MNAPLISSWLTALALTGAAALAQPTPQPVTKPSAHDRADAEASRPEIPDDPALARRFLERRLEETQKREERLRADLKRLEGGAKPSELEKDIEPNPRAGKDVPGRIGNRPERTGEKGERGPDRPGHEKLTPADRERVMEFLKTHTPELFDRFAKLSASDPDGTDRILGRMWPRIREALGSEQRDPKLFQLRIDEIRGGVGVVDAIKEFRDATTAAPADKARIDRAGTQLRSALSKQLDIRLSLQLNEIDALTQRLADLKADVDRRKATRDASIDTMVERIRDGKDGRDGPPGPGHDAPPGEPRATPRPQR